MSSNIDQPVIIIGCGYLGNRLLNALKKRKLCAIDNMTALVKTQSSQEQCEQAGIRAIALDMDNADEHLPDNFPIAHALIYYFAPPPSHGTEDTRARNFLKQLSSLAVPPDKIVLISTTGVYGNCHGQWVNEETPLNPSLDRARRRYDAEQQFQHFCKEKSCREKSCKEKSSHEKKVSLVILRVSGIYGPGKLPLKRIKAQTPVVREEDSPFSNRIHADDLLEVCIKAGSMNEVEGIFNCADGHPTTMCDYFMKVARANNLPKPPTISLEQAKEKLSAGMLSYMKESRRIENKKLLSHFKLSLKFPDLDKGLVLT